MSLSERTADIVSLVSFDDFEVLSQKASIPCLAASSVIFISTIVHFYTCKIIKSLNHKYDDPPPLAG